MIGVAAVRNIVGLGTTAERYAAVIHSLIVATKEADSFSAYLATRPPVEQADFGLDRACADASSQMCKDLVIPELTDEQRASSFGALLQYSAACSAKSKFVFVLYTPAKT